MSTTQDLLLASPDLDTQLVLGLLQAVAWWVITRTLGALIAQSFSTKPWRDRWLALCKSTNERSYGVFFDDDVEHFHMATNMLAVGFQHAVGGALCLPSALGIASPLAFALARHGALCEVGWELQDVAVRLTQLLFGGKVGRARNPAGLLLILGIHHAMALSLVIPVNVFYPQHRGIHEMVFLLQGAAAVAMFAQNYGYTLDIQTRRGLRAMKANVLVVWAVILWSRVLRFAWVFSVILREIVEDGNLALSAVGAAVVLAMSYVNYIFFADATKKMLKFGRMRPPSPDSPDAKRRLSEAAALAQGAFGATRTSATLQRWASGEEGPAAAAQRLGEEKKER